MKAIIPAAWYWTRMLPITKTIPKEMLPVWNKPVIQYIVEWLAYWWIEEIWIITSQGKSTLEDYFDKNYELEDILKKKWKERALQAINTPKYLANYVFFKQKEQLWFPHAVWETRNRITDNFFFVSVWDQFWNKEIYKGMIDLHKKTKQPIVSVQEVPEEVICNYWVVKIEGDAILDIIEKPKTLQEAPSNLVCNWMYILPKEFFTIVSETKIDSDKGEIVMPDCLLQLLWKYKLLPYVCWKEYRDVWTSEAWLRANNETKSLWYR